MLWHDATRRMALLGLLSLGACGFAPVHGTGSGADALQNQVSLTTPDTVIGFRTRARLEDRLGFATAPAYRLTVTLNVTQDNVAITEEGDITRITLPGQATFTLSTLSGATVSTGTASSFTSYSTTGTTVATRAAANDARDRLAIILADQIVAQLAAVPLP